MVLDDGLQENTWGSFYCKPFVVIIKYKATPLKKIVFMNLSFSKIGPKYLTSPTVSGSLHKCNTTHWSAHYSATLPENPAVCPG